MNEYEIKFGKHRISFSVVRSKRKTLETTVQPDLSVVAKAPEDVPIEKIIEKVQKRAFWIIKQKRYFTEFLPKAPPRKYVSGETHRYLGRQYRLKVLSTDKDDVKLKGKYFIIESRNKNNPEHNKKLLYKWYRKNAVQKFDTIFNEQFKRLKKYGIKKPKIEIKVMKSRWGSTSPNKNKIILNTELIKAPVHCIEYIITHETCHLKYPNHDKKFYDFLSMVMPDWKERKGRLEKVVL